MSPDYNYNLGMTGYSFPPGMNPADAIVTPRETVGDIARQRMTGSLKWAFRDIVNNSGDMFEDYIARQKESQFGRVGDFFFRNEAVKNTVANSQKTLAHYEKLAAYSDTMDDLAKEAAKEGGKQTTNATALATAGTMAAGGAAVSYKHMFYGANPEEVKKASDLWRNMNTVLSEGDENAGFMKKAKNFIKNEHRLNAKGLLSPFKKGRTLQAALITLAWGTMVWGIGKAGLTGWQNSREDNEGTISSTANAGWESLKKGFKSLGSWTFGSIFYGLSEGGLEKINPKMKGKWYTSLASITIATIAGLANNVALNSVLPNESRKYNLVAPTGSAMPVEHANQMGLAGFNPNNASALDSNPFDQNTQELLKESGLFS